MAGSIFISKELRLPVSTRQFDYLVKHLADAFLSEEQNIREQVFRPLEEGGMDFITAEGLSESEFGRFCAAVDRANRHAHSEKEFPVYQQLWDELLKRIHADIRFSA
jgi:hypothetical protein